MRTSRWMIGMLIFAALVALDAAAQTAPYNGLDLNMGNLSRLSHAKTRSISPENLTGEKGKGGMATVGTGAEAARDLGQGWKISPSVKIEPKKVFTLAEIQGPGAIQHIWMTPTGNFRFSIVRIYWDGESTTFGRGARRGSLCLRLGKIRSSLIAGRVCEPRQWAQFLLANALPQVRKLTLENLDDVPMTIYYQIDYVLTEVPEDAAYFHAQFRRSNPLPYKTDHVILDGVKGWGHYVGTYLAWGVHNTGWWGEGEIKFFLDGDTKFPTINGTGTEDYFCGSYDFDAGPPADFSLQPSAWDPSAKRLPLSGVHYPLHGVGAGDPPGWAL